MDMLSLGLWAARLIGWTLVQFLWQAGVVGLAYAVARRLLPRGEARYRSGMIALLLLALCPVLTLWRLRGGMAPAMDGDALWLPDRFARAGAAPTGATAWPGFLDAALPWLVLVWLLGVLLLSVRAWRQWLRLQWMVRRSERLPQWQQYVAGMAARFSLRRRVVVLGSALVDTPMLVGWLRPVILMPAAVAMGFPVAQVEWILAHELAHLRRWDPLANLFQVVLETLHFYHPVVRWISRDVRNERELCCDRMALMVKGGNRREFAAALAGLGELRASDERLRLAASGGVLLERVRHLAAPSSASAVTTRTPARHAAVLLGALLLTLALQRIWLQGGMQDRLAEVAMPTLREAALARTPMLSLQLPDLVPRYLTGLPARDLLSAQDELPPIHPMPLRIAEARAALSWRLPDWTKPAKANPVALADAPLLLPEAASALQVRRASPPPYPAWALQRHIEGRVTVAFALTSDGSVRDLQVIASTPVGVFDRAVIDAVRGWQFAPPAGGAGERRFRQTLRFELPHQAGRASGERSMTRRDCRPVTGSLICRYPSGGDDAAAPG